MQIPQGNFDQTISSSAPTPSNPIQGSLAIGKAVENIGEMGVNAVIDATDIEAKTKALNFYEPRVAQDRLETVDFTTKTSKLINKDGNINAGTTLSNGTRLEKETPYKEVIKTYQDDLLSRAEVDAPNQHAVNGYRSKAGQFFQSNELESQRFQAETFYNGIKQTIGESKDNYNKSMRILGTKIYEPSQNIMGVAEDGIISQFKSIDDYYTKGVISIAEAEVMKKEAVDEGVSNLFAGIQSSFRNPTLMKSKKKEMLETFSKVAFASEKGKRASPLFQNLSPEVHNKIQQFVSDMNIDLGVQAASEGKIGLDSYENLAFTKGYDEKTQLELSNLREDTLNNLRQGLSPLKYSEAAGKIAVIDKARETFKSMDQLPPSKMDGAFQAAMNEADSIVDKDWEAILDPKDWKGVKPSMLTSEYKSTMSKFHKMKKEELLKEIKEDPAQYTLEHTDFGRLLLKDYNSEVDPKTKGAYLKQIKDYTDVQQTTLAEVPSYDQRSLPKGIVKQVVGDFNSLSKEYDLSKDPAKFDALVESLGPAMINTLSAQATKDGIKEFNKNIFSAMYFSHDKDTKNLILNLEAERLNIEKNYADKWATQDKFKKSDIDAAKIKLLAPFNEHAMYNLNGKVDSSINDSIMATGELYIKDAIDKRGISVDTATTEFADIAKKAFSLISVRPFGDFSNPTKILVAGNIPEKAVTDFLENNLGNGKAIGELLKEGRIKAPSFVNLDQVTGKPASPERVLEQKKQWLLTVQNSMKMVATPEGLTPAYKDSKGKMYFLEDQKGEPFVYKWQDVINDPQAKDRASKNFFKKFHHDRKNHIRPYDNVDYKEPVKSTNTPVTMKKSFGSALTVPPKIQAEIDRHVNPYGSDTNVIIPEGGREMTKEEAAGILSQVKKTKTKGNPKFPGTK